MRRQHHSLSGTSYIKPFIIFGTLSASLFFNTPSLVASDFASASADANLKPSTVTAPSNRVSALFTDVRQYLGIRYRFGGTTPAGFDCSGFVRFMFGRVFDMQLPRSSREMSAIGTRVARSELKPGDLVFFRNARNRINHVGIFVGNGMFVHSSLTKGITSDRLNENYYEKRFATGVRLLDMPEQQSQQDFDKIMKEASDNGDAS
jgi:cell wall-associated NlpC family hydrolase